VLGSRTIANVSIVDNDPGLGFELGSYSVWENADEITVMVLRGNDVALGPLTTDYATSDRSAKAGQDYQAVSGTLVFAENETVKTITVPILRDGLITNSTSFTVTLSNLTVGATLWRSSTTVNILDASGLTSRTVTPPFDTALTIRSEGGVNLITWTGGGQLQRADRPTGPWQTLTTATNPFTIQSALPTTFYRVTRPRPVDLYIPSSYDSQTPMPLVIFLPGYNCPDDCVESYIELRPLAEARGFLYCYPNGTTDSAGNQFWNATDGCCDFFSTGTDDAGYLRAVIEEIGRQFAVDRKRVHLIGHSNGGFMAYRMACQSADLIAGVASVAGTSFLDPSRCAPSQLVNILHIHGTADDRILYAGGALTPATIPGLLPGNMPAYPGALQTVQFWAGYNGARDPVTDPGPSMDIDLDVSGLDTVITRYTHFPPGGAVELWTINGGSHVPTFYSGSFSSEFGPRVIDWLLAHPKP
jgi:polyhydroxybutyrate depolymerase